jgi:hypothetical protein
LYLLKQKFSVNVVTPKQPELVTPLKLTQTISPQTSDSTTNFKPVVQKKYVPKEEQKKTQPSQPNVQQNINQPSQSSQIKIVTH